MRSPGLLAARLASTGGTAMSSDGTPLSAANLPWLEELHEEWERDARSVGESWDEFFRGPGEHQPARGIHRGAGRAAARALGHGLQAEPGRQPDLGLPRRRLPLRAPQPAGPRAGEQKNYYTEPEHSYEQLTLAEFGLAEAGSRPGVLRGQGPLLREDEALRDHPRPAGDLLLHDRRGVPPHPEQARCAAGSSSRWNPRATARPSTRRRSSSCWKTSSTRRSSSTSCTRPSSGRSASPWRAPRWSSPRSTTWWTPPRPWGSRRSSWA